MRIMSALAVADSTVGWEYFPIRAQTVYSFMITVFVAV